MNRTWQSRLVLGIGAGMVAGLLMLAAGRTGIGLRFLMSILALQPGMLIGLGWGWQAAAVAAVSGALLVAASLGGLAGVVFLGIVGVPGALLALLAGLRREVPNAAGSALVVEWFPVGRIVVGATLWAMALAVTFAVYLGFDSEATKAALRHLVEAILATPMPGADLKKPTEEQVGRLVELTYSALPAVAGVSWLSSFLFNLILAGRVTLASGRLARPWPDMAALTYPRGFPLLMALGLALTMGSELTGLIGVGMAGPMLFAYFLLGLAIIHWQTRGRPMRSAVLAATYSIVFLFNGWAMLLIAMIGLAEPFSPLRRNLDPRPPSGPSTGT